MIDLLLAAVPAAGGLGSPADMWAAIVHDFATITEPAAFAAFLQVLMIDLVLAGDNAIVVGALAAGLPPEQRKKVILIGVLAALVLRIAFALVVTQLMQVIGLILVGGLLLLWVALRMWRDLHHEGESFGSEEILGDEHSGLRPAKSFSGAVWAVAVAARDHPGILIVGLIFAVGLMGIAANLIARYIERYKWIAYVGLLVILYVALKMIYDGWVDPQVGLGRMLA